MSEQKTVEDDIKAYTQTKDSLLWVDEADVLYSRMNTLERKVQEINVQCCELKESTSTYKVLKENIKDLSTLRSIVVDVESLEFNDVSELKESISQYNRLKQGIVDLREVVETVSLVDSIIISNVSELKESISQYKEYVSRREVFACEVDSLKGELPDTCPYCGARINKEVMNVC